MIVCKSSNTTKNNSDSNYSDNTNISNRNIDNNKNNKKFTATINDAGCKNK